jgi:SPP1 family phage portal protein
MSANISDDTFGNVASGEAMAYKLLATGTMLSTFDTKISKSLQKRYKILCSLSTNSPDPNAWEDVEIQFHRNIPKNTAAEIENAKNVAGMVSQETQLSLMPSVIPDVAAELERIAAEREDIQSRLNVYGSFGVHEEEPEEPDDEPDETEVNDGKKQG